MPLGVEEEGLGQGAGRGYKYRLHLPAVKNVSPAGPELHCGLKLAQQVVTVEVCAAVHKYAIFGIKFPDGIASPVEVHENSLGLVAGPQESDSFLGEQVRLAGVLVSSKIDPLYQRKHSNQNDNGKVKRRPEPRRDGCPESCVFRDLGASSATTCSDRESRGDYRYRHQNENWYVADGVQSGERSKEEGHDHTSLRPRAGTGECDQKQ